MTRYYLAGSMAAEHLYRYREAADQLRGRGLAVTSPLDLPPVAGGRPWSQVLRGNLRAMLDCDTVVLLRGWRDAQGANLARDVAVKVHMPVIEYADLLASLRRGSAVDVAAVPAGGRARPGRIGGAR